MTEGMKKHFIEDQNAYYINKGVRYCRSVHFRDQTRFEKAKEQAQLTPPNVDEVICHINNFLSGIGMEQPVYPKVSIKEPEEEPNYKKIMKDNNLKDERDIVWLKFTKDGYIGVVATSNDVNFSIPKSRDEYNLKENNWKYNTSGIIVHYLNKEWDESFVLLVPLKKIPEKLTRRDIEKGLGNYLIDKKVPILDFYSHNY